MKPKYTILIALLAVSGFVLKAQNAGEHSIKFDKNTHEFGDLKQGVPAEFIFEFTNISDTSVKLTNVKASCGCTTPTWPREEIKAGATGEIVVRYNAKAIGPFNKSIRVNYEGRVDPVTLFIRGKVLAPETDDPVGVAAPPKDVLPKINYGVPRGALSFEKMIENVGHMTSEESKSVLFKYRNNSNKQIKILLGKTELDPEVSFMPKHKILAPGMESEIEIKINGEKMKSSSSPNGYFSKQIVLYTDEVEGARKQLTVNGTYKRIYTEAEKTKSPKIKFETVNVNGGKIIEGEKFEFDYNFTNTGGSPLILTSVKPSCGCTTPFWPQGKEITPGESEKISVSFNSRGRVGTQTKSITVYSNAVETPTEVLKFTVEVVKDPFHADNMMEERK